MLAVVNARDEQGDAIGLWSGEWDQPHRPVVNDTFELMSSTLTYWIEYTVTEVVWRLEPNDGVAKVLFIYVEEKVAS